MTESEELLAKQIATGLETTTNLIQSLSSDVRENTKNIATIQADLKNLSEDVRHLSKILKDGNGSAPVLSRLAVLEQTITNSLTLEKDLEGIKTKIVTWEAKAEIKKETKKEEIEDLRYRGSGKLQMWIAVLSSIVAIGAAILGVVFK